MEAIFNRRSVRSYTDEPVSEEQITTLLRAAMRAPSAGNSQPWEFVVLQKRETMQAIQQFQPYTTMLSEAPLCIVVCGNKTRLKFPQYDYWVQDCSAAIQNILLEAVHLGLGAVWLGLHPVAERTEAMQELLNLPKDVIPLGAVAIGHPKQTPAPQNTFDETRIHREKWLG